MGGALSLSGLYVPLVTPFDERLEVDLRSLERLSHELLDGGAAGLVALATTGEASALDAGERSAVVTICARVCGERESTLVVGAGTNDTRTTIARHEALGEIPGVHASLAVVPYYVRPSEAAIVNHFRAVAAHSPVPLVIYNIPYRTGRGLGCAALLELAATDNVAGLKQAVDGIDADTLELLAAAPDDFAVLGGDDPYLYPVVLMGGSGAIAASAHLCTGRFAAMIECGLSGELRAGRAHAAALLALTRALFAEPSPAIIKGLLHAQGRIATPHVRMPLADASAGAIARAAAALDAATPR